MKPSFVRRLGDLVNPIAVKELRQAVRGRFVVTLIVLAMLAQMVTVIIAMVGQRLESTSIERSPVGGVLFMTIFSVLMFGSIVLIPFYTGLRMAAERSDSNVDLLFITTIRPRNIVLGKLLSASALTALIFGASVPFLAFTYVLRGIDFMMIAYVTATGFVLVVSQSILALFVGALPASRPFKIVLAFALFMMSIGTTVSITETAMRSVRYGAALGAGGAWRELAGALTAIVAVDVLLIFLTIALISPPSANRALPLRILLTMLWAATLGVAVWITLANSNADVLLVWAVIALTNITLVLFSAIGEREEWGPRVTRTIPQPLLKRLLAFAFYSGGGGTVWAVVMMGATLLAYAAIAPRFVSRFDASDVTIWLSEGAACIVGYAGTALWLRRTVLAQRIPPRATWSIILGLFILLAIVPPLAAFAVEDDSAAFTTVIKVTTLANPFPVTSPPHVWLGRTIALAAWALLAIAANVPWLMTLFSRFRRQAIVERQAPRLSNEPALAE